jgi:hypothetical protein
MSRLRRILTALALTLGLVAAGAVTAPAAHASDCGGQVTDWVPNLLTSEWLIEAFDEGNPKTGAIVLSYVGQAAVTTFLDPLSVGQGQYDHDGPNDGFIWYATDLFNQGDRFTFFATAITCNGAETQVLAAGGPVVEYGVGEVGVFYMTRIL